MLLGLIFVRPNWWSFAFDSKFPDNRKDPRLY
jgi:hypothetical protein